MWFDANRVLLKFIPLFYDLNGFLMFTSKWSISELWCWVLFN